MKNKGIRVNRGKKRHFKVKNHSEFFKILKIILFVILLGAIGFFGYSVVSPILNYSWGTKDEPSSSFSFPVNSHSSNSSESDGNIPSVPAQKPKTVAYYLNAADLTNAETLSAALAKIPSTPSDLSYNTVVVPLKSEGGSINFMAAFEPAVTANVVTSTLPLSQIYSSIFEKGYTPVAEINLLQDNIYPRVYGDTAYKLNDGSGWNWLNNSPELGGKSWLSAFAAGTKTYLSAITQEVAQAGFSEIIFSGVMFPTNSAKIESRATAPNRYTALLSLVSSLSVPLVDIQSGVKVSALEVLNGKAEVMKPDALATSYYLTIDFNDFSKSINANGADIKTAEMTKPEIFRNVIEQVKVMFPTANILPIVDATGLSLGEVWDLKNISDEFEFESFYIFTKIV